MPPAFLRIRVLRENEPVTEVHDGETLDVECRVGRIYPVDDSHDIGFQLASGDSVVVGRETVLSGVSISTNFLDDTLSVTKDFSVEFNRSYSSPQQGLACGVFHPRGYEQSERLPVIVSCESKLRCICLDFAISHHV